MLAQISNLRILNIKLGSIYDNSRLNGICDFLLVWGFLLNYLLRLTLSLKI